jgi:hypothetical protein
MPYLILKCVEAHKYSLSMCIHTLFVDQMPVTKEMRSFKRWSTAPIEMNRPIMYAACSHNTLENNERDVHGYLGFLLHHFNAPLQLLSINMYTKPNKFITFMSYLRTRNVESSFMKRHVATAKKVSVFLRATNPTAHTNDFWNKLEAWYTVLGNQLTKARLSFGKKRKDSEQDPLPSASSILHLSDSIRERGRSLLRRDTKYHGGVMQVDTLRALRDHAMLSCMFGDMPPVRLSSLRTLLHPDNITPVSCEDPECRHAQCQGNRMQFVVQDNQPVMYPGGRDGQKLRLVIVHHKSRNRTGKLIAFDVPQSWVANGGWRYICSVQPMLTAKTKCKRLFVNDSGNPFNSAGLKNWFYNVQKSEHYDSAAMGEDMLPPSKLRNVFVTSLQDMADAPGPSNLPAMRHAAMAMGSSMRQVHAHYDTNYDTRAAQVAVDRCQAWKQMVKKKNVVKEEKVDAIVCYSDDDGDALDDHGNESASSDAPGTDVDDDGVSLSASSDAPGTDVDGDNVSLTISSDVPGTDVDDDNVSLTISSDVPGTDVDDDTVSFTISSDVPSTVVNDDDSVDLRSSSDEPDTDVNDDDNVSLSGNDDLSF